MVENIASNKDFFDINLERDNIFQEIFAEKNPNVYQRTKLYDFCSHDTAFTDLADYIFSGGTCMTMNTSLYKIVSEFIEHINIFYDFSEQEKEDIIKKVNITFSKTFLSLKSHQQKVLEEILSVMDIKNQTMH